ncbi:MAG: phosphodiester glycosidase family protein [Chitinophagaceae bacterium]
MIRIASLVMICFLASCSKKVESTTIIPPVVQPPVTPKPTLITLPAGWKLSTTYGTNFPTGIQVYQFDTIHAGRQVKAVCVAYDSKVTTIDFKPVLSATAITPTAFAAAESGTIYACMNGGYFGSNQSFSLVKYNNTVSSPNIKALTRSFNGSNTSYFPTRAAFGITATGSPSVAWIYNVGTGNNLIYSYPSPSPNLLNTAPQPQPSETFPANGTVWNTVSAIGGSPVLIKNNNIQITAAEELIEVNNTSSRPRSAIGYNSNGIVMLLAVEGDNAPTYTGINLADLASMLKNLGCTEAINLDGGGSTSLVINGTRTVRPGDNGVERPVVSAIIIKQK